MDEKKWNAVPSHRLSQRVWTDQGYYSSRYKESNLALEWNPSKNIRLSKSYNRLRCNARLSRLQWKVWDLYWRLDTRIGAVITQNNRSLAFFSRKLSDTQKWYNVTKKELLSIVDTLKEFKGMFWGQKLVVYTDHKNIIQDALGLSSDCVYRWRLLIKEHGPEIIYIKGINNTVADAISRLHFSKPHSLIDQRQNWMILAKCWCWCTAI